MLWRKMVKVELTKKAEEVMRRVIQEYGKVYMILGDTGCCGYSNVFLTTFHPESSYEYVGEYSGAEIYVHHAFRHVVDEDIINIDAVEIDVDDSFSLETNFGYRLILKPSQNIRI